MTEARRDRAARYRNAMAGTSVRLPAGRPDVRRVSHVLAVRVPQRGRWRERLTAAGIQTGVHYPMTVHLQPAHADLGYKAGDSPVSETAAADVWSLPIFPELTDAQIDAVTGVFRAGA